MKGNFLNYVRRNQALGAALLSVGPAIVILVDAWMKSRGLGGLSDEIYISTSLSAVAVGTFWVGLGTYS